MLTALSRRLRSSRSLGFHHWPRPPYPLCAMVTHGGCELRTSPDYDWNGLKRGDAEFALFQYTLSGEGRLTFHGTTHVVRPGQAMLLSFPDDNRYWLPAGLTWEHFFVCLSGREVMSAVRHVIERRGPLLDLDPDSPAVRQAATATERIVRGQLSSVCENSASAYALVMALVSQATAHTPPRLASGQLERAVAFCREHFASDISVADMATAAGYSRYHFTRLFKEVHGVSPTDYLSDLRLSTATRLLRESEASVREVAAACGFADAAYFCKVFRKAIGTSPGSYRASGMYTG